MVDAIRAAVCRVYPGCWVVKIVGHPYQESGIPDLLLLIEGHLFGLEAKYQRPGESRQHAVGRATPGQLMQLRRIERAGGTAAVIVSAAEAIEIIQRELGQKEN